MIGPSPFIEPIGGNDAALLLDTPAKGGLLEKSFCPRIDHLVTGAFVLSPWRHQSPTHRFQHCAGRRTYKHRRILPRGDIKPGLKILSFCRPGPGLLSKRIASAHAISA